MIRSSGKEIATVAFEGNPELGASDGKGRIFVNVEDKAEIAEIDSVAMRVTHTWPLPGCEEPSGLALDVAHARLFSVCQNGTMAITDADSGRQVARVAIGEGPDGAAFDPATQMAFSPNGKSGTLTVVHEDDPDHFRVVQTLATQASARTIALDPARTACTACRDLFRATRTRPTSPTDGARQFSRIGGDAVAVALIVGFETGRVIDGGRPCPLAKRHRLAGADRMPRDFR